MSLVLTHRLSDEAQARRRQRYHVGWLVLALAILTAAVVCRVPKESIEESVTVRGIGLRLPSVCPSRQLLGVSCPGCGLTRSFVALTHGQFAQAWAFNPAGFFWFAALIWQVPYRAVQLHLLRRGRELRVQRGVTEGVVLALVAACLVQWVARLV